MSQPAARPLGVYIHWPYCARICPYCDFNVVRERGRANEKTALLEAIGQDLREQRELTGPRRLVSVHLGGGTPSLLEPREVAELVATACALWDPDDGLEVALEANPADASRFAGLAGAGVERLSLGLQSLTDANLAFLGRDHSAAAGMRAALTAIQVFPRVSLDLIYALPGQSVFAWAAELEAAAGFGAEHVSAYQLTVEPGTAFARAVRRKDWAPLPADEAAAFYRTTRDVLAARGFDAYEVSNHARGPTARSRHNLIYWRGEDYVGVGPGAHGRLTLDGERIATAAARRIGDYIGLVARMGVGWETREALTPVEAAQERLLMGLRTIEGVALAELRPLGLGPGHPKVGELVGAGLLVQGLGRIAATSEGRLVLDRITAELASV